MNNFKIGDVVLDKEDKKGIIIYVSIALDDKTPYVSVLYKSCAIWRKPEDLRPIGIHYPQLSKMLEVINE